MARGWESKSVEEQQSEAAVSSTRPGRPLTPEELARRRVIEGIALSRKRVLRQLETARDPRHRAILQAALAELDGRLAQLG